MPARLSSVLTAGALLAGIAAFAPAAPAGAATAVTCRLPVFGPGADYHPDINPARFGPNVDNQWFPLLVGSTYVYSGTKDGKTALDIVVATDRTIVIDGVTARVVEDRLYLNGFLAERTSDYYAQDVCGNVWYFGEDTAELDHHGNVISTEGSFHAGVDGAEPGVFMQATPQRDRVFRQEWYEGHAEDQFQAVSIRANVHVPYGHYDNALQTLEKTDLEPGVLDAKYYAPGVGELKEVSLSGPLEEMSLVEIIS
jgi:hypothetical protein